MRLVDGLLEDEQLLDTIYEAQGERYPQSRRRGREQTGTGNRVKPNRIEAGKAKAQPNRHREPKATAPVLDSTSKIPIDPGSAQTVLRTPDTRYAQSRCAAPLLAERKRPSISRLLCLLMMAFRCTAGLNVARADRNGDGLSIPGGMAPTLYDGVKAIFP